MKNIFVSSTFKDMQEERNLLHTQIMPNVNDALKQKGTYANFLDFRWGIDTENLTEDVAMRKVLSACFDGINDSTYVIALIGENYGSCVPQSIINEIEKHYEISCNGNEKSITELEIDYATDSKFIDSENIVFYFKEEHAENYDERVIRLKKKIEKLYPNRVKNYNLDGDEFVKQVTEDVLFWFDKHMDVLDSMEDNITAENVLRFSCRQELLDDSVNEILDNSFTVVYGESGCGKSVFMSALKDNLSQKCHADIIYIKKSVYNHEWVIRELWDFSGSTIIKYYPNYKLNHDCFDLEKAISATFSIINNAHEIKDFVFLIDGIDKFNSREVNEILMLLKNYSPKLHLVVSLDNPNKYIFIQKPKYIYLSRLSYEDKEKVIKKELEINHKTLTDEVIHKLIHKKDAGLPLYLILAIKRLVNMQESDYNQIYNGSGCMALSINNYIMDIIIGFSDDIKNMIIDYIEFSENIIDKEQARNIVSFLSAGVYGFTDTELYFLIDKYSVISIPKWYSNSFRDNYPLWSIGLRNYSTVDFYLFCRYLGNLINVNTNNGKIRFENTIVQNAIFELYHGEIFLDLISDEVYYESKNRVLSDYEICNAVLRTRIIKNSLYPPLYLINSYMKENNQEQLELLANILFDLLINDGVNILNNYMEKANSYRKYRKCNKEETFNSMRFGIEHLFPKVSNSMINPIEFVPFFEDCISNLKKFMDYSLIDNRLYLIMARFNIAIMCYNSNNVDKALCIAKQCESKLNAIPKKMRNSLYNDAVESYKSIVFEWGE